MADSILKLSRSLIKIDTNKDFLSDQFHYQVTFTILVISAFASTSLQFYADPIQMYSTRPIHRWLHIVCPDIMLAK